MARDQKVNWSYRNDAGKGDVMSAYAIHQKFFAESSVIMAPQGSWDMADFKGFDGADVAVINLSGPIMKNDYCGSFGTASIANLVKMASNTQSVHTILLLIDSPGGTVDGTSSLAQTLQASSKRTIAASDGYICSAAYWIGSSCDELWAMSDTDVIGSIGTMCTLVDNTEAMKTRGVVVREFYATASTDKNKAFTDAQKGNGKALVSEMLDPINDIFINAVRANRGTKIDSGVLTGKTYLGKEAVNKGLADGVKSIDEMMKYAMQRPMNAGMKSTSVYTTKSNIKNMEINSVEALRANYGPLCTEMEKAAAKAAVETERDRVAAYMEYADVDLKAAKEGIASGNNPSQKFFAEMSRKAMSKEGIQNMGAASAPPIPKPAADPAAGVPATAEEQQTKAFADELTKGILERLG